MRASFWIRRFLTVLALAALIIGGAQLLKGYDLAASSRHAAIWAPITAVIFTGGRFFQSRRGRHCALCRDTPGMGVGAGGTSAPSPPPRETADRPTVQ